VYSHSGTINIAMEILYKEDHGCGVPVDSKSRRESSSPGTDTQKLFLILE
jgi:hypothetical protein